MSDIPSSSNEFQYRYVTPAITDFFDITRIDDTEYVKARGLTVSSFKDYKLVKYNKTHLASDNVATLGLWRSVVIRNGRIVSFAPPKAMSLTAFTREFSASAVELEEFVEGTMINVFWDGDDWQIASRSLIGANGFYYKGSPTFRRMFLEAMTYAGCELEFSMLDRRLIYSFVVCHPGNRIVVPIKTPHLYLVEVFHSMPDGRIGSLDIQHPGNKPVLDAVLSRVLVPRRYALPSPDTTGVVSSSQQGVDTGDVALTEETISSPVDVVVPDEYGDIRRVFASNTTPFHQLGVIMRAGVSGQRTKMRNPVYEFVRALRGNSPKLMYQYLHLRRNGKVGAFLRFYPEYLTEFNQFRTAVHEFTRQLHDFYIMVHVKKLLDLKDVDGEYKAHVYALHKLYLDSLKVDKRVITMTETINYVNEIDPARLMYALNYKKRVKHSSTAIEAATC
jgi:hypothetical protein